MTEREIFLEALEKATLEERAAYLQAACGGDVALRRKADELLKEHFSNDSLLAGPALEGDRASEPKPPAAEAPAQTIGRYKLLEKIGEGGFGEVWMAEQREPVKRRVALKIIKLGMDSRQIVARFEAERQALAMMDHANIAKIFDAGTTDNGRPYFVMELVRGIKITDYCDQKQLPTEERLKLFILVCHAIQHAHQKGIIHRDVKPSNILVTLHDGVPVPKVIDFGIAKATQQELTDKTLFTQFQQFIGTPAYISPEQAEMSGLDIDTRADIYSLGVLLYELLVGQTPFDAKEMMRGGIDALRQIIREQEPLRPSTKLNTLQGDARTAAGKSRQADIGRLVHQLQGDLDWIAMKCLEKDRARRYETASGLASDIQRYLNNEPVVARPPSNFYRLQKLVRRNKLAFAAAGAVTTMLLLGIIGSTWQAMRAIRAEHEQSHLRQEAEAARTSESRAREQAEDAAKKSENVLAFMHDMFLRAASRYTDRGTVYADQISVLQMLDLGAADATNRFRNQPDAAAGVQFSIGLCYSAVAEWDRARDHLQMALNLQDQLVGFVHPDTLATARQLASVALAQGKHEEAKALCHKILDATTSGQAAAQRRASDKASFRTAELWTCRKLAQVYLEEGEFSQAKPLISKLIAAAQAHELTVTEAGHAWSEAGNVALGEGHPQEALKAFDTELSFYPEGMVVQRAWCNGLRGAAYLALGEFEKAEPLLTNTLPVLQRRFGDSHFRVRRAFRDLVSLYTNTGRLEQAELWKIKLVEPDKTAAGKKRAVSPGSLELAATLAQTTQLLLEVQKCAEAEPLAREFLAIHEKLLPDGWLIFYARSLLGASLLGQEKYADAEPLLLSGYEGMNQREAKIPPAGKVRLSEALQRLAQLYEETNRPDQAAAWRKKLAESRALFNLESRTNAPSKN